jgi:hypothetical protein
MKINEIKKKSKINNILEKKEPQLKDKKWEDNFVFWLSSADFKKRREGRKKNLTIANFTTHAVIGHFK